MFLYDVSLIEVPQEGAQRVLAFCRVVAESPAQAAQLASENFKAETFDTLNFTDHTTQYHLVAVALAPVPNMTRKVITPTAQEIIQVAKH